MLAMDVDGVLTDGSIMLDDDGREIKRFNVRDGLGITTWMKLGFQTAIITRREGGAVAHRARELGITHVVQGSRDKGLAIDELASASGIPAAEMAFVGDDWPDLPAMRKVGFAVAVADADERVKGVAAMVTTRAGGRGAVREVVEHLLGSKGMMERALGGH